MHILNKHLLLSLLIGTTCAATAQRTLFEEMVEEINEMQMRFERRMNRFHEEMKKAFAAPLNNTIDSPNIAITENKTNNCLEIIVFPLVVKEKIFDASMDQDTNSMIIVMPAGSLQIQIAHHLISATFNYQFKQEQDQKSNKTQIMFNSHIQNAKIINSELAFEESHIEYDQATQKLIVTIPFRKKNITKVPVSIKENPKSEQK